MRVLAIDPGYERLGIAIIEKSSSKKDTLLYSDCFRTSAKDPFEERLLQIGDEVERIISLYTPTIYATEQLYFSNNQKTAMQVAEARGVLSYISKKHSLTAFEYSPLQIKSAVTGHGKSDKTQVAKMVPLLIAVPNKKMLDDEYDAIAIGLTCLASERPNF